MKYVMTLLVFLTFSCKSQKASGQKDDRLILLVQDGYFPAEEPETHIIQDAKTLRAFYAQLNKTRKPGLPVPQVDFSTSSVLIACMGPVDTDALPRMYVNRETVDEFIISAGILEEKTSASTNSSPFCIYTLSNMGKKVTIEFAD